MTWLNHIGFKIGVREIADKRMGLVYNSLLSIKSELLLNGLNYKVILLNCIPESKLQIQEEFGENEAVQENGRRKIKRGALARCSPQHALTRVDEGNVAYILQVRISSNWRLLEFQCNQLPALFRLFMVHSFQAGISSLQAVCECRCQQPSLPWGEKLEGGRRTPLLRLDLQVWEPSRKEESERWQAGMQRKYLFLKPIVLFQPFSCHIFFHFRFPQVPAICSSSHEQAVLPFQVQRTYMGGIPCASAWLSWARPHFVNTVTRLGGSSSKVAGEGWRRKWLCFCLAIPFFPPFALCSVHLFHFPWLLPSPLLAKELQAGLPPCHSTFFLWSNTGES